MKKEDIIKDIMRIAEKIGTWADTEMNYMADKADVFMEDSNLHSGKLLEELIYNGEWKLTWNEDDGSFIEADYHWAVRSTNPDDPNWIIEYVEQDIYIKKVK